MVSCVLLSTLGKGAYYNKPPLALGVLGGGEIRECFERAKSQDYRNAGLKPDDASSLKLDATQFVSSIFLDNARS